MLLFIINGLCLSVYPLVFLISKTTISNNLKSKSKKVSRPAKIGEINDAASEAQGLMFFETK